MTKIIAITIGDIKGIGIDILIDSWIKKKINNFILFSNIDVIKKYIKKRKINVKLNLISKQTDNFNFVRSKINIISFNINSLEDNTYKSIKYAYNFCVNDRCIGLITLPIRKDLIKKKIDSRFVGHTEYFQKLNKKKYANMVFFHKKIIISPITTHIEVKKISKFISNKKFLYNQIYNLNKCLKIDFGLNKPRLIISGFNPHAGENGNIGNEEQKYIIPTINKLKKNGVNIKGPFSADSILIQKNLENYDCFIFIFHDQALIPFKYISKFSGVNYTGNLDIIRTSPDHGTAYNLVGTNKISNKSFINCFRLIKKIYQNRQLND
ncbi:4-hydroxythreonine-4-phosphate dehydrogenase PdxA [Pelagibacteraceae bacterium]|nr:4-hydroxythreonine-4-phosphate dehydrogenase PdxA [Pelagibacteraceae bacterium]